MTFGRPQDGSNIARYISLFAITSRSKPQHVVWWLQIDRDVRIYTQPKKKVYTREKLINLYNTSVVHQEAPEFSLSSECTMNPCMYYPCSASLSTDSFSIQMFSYPYSYCSPAVPMFNIRTQFQCLLLSVVHNPKVHCPYSVSS